MLAIAAKAGVSATASPLAERDLGAIDGARAEFHAVDNREYDDFTPLPTTSSMADGNIVPNGDHTETATVKRRVNRNSRRGQIISLRLEVP